MTAFVIIMATIAIGFTAMTIRVHHREAREHREAPPNNRIVSSSSNRIFD